MHTDRTGADCPDIPSMSGYVLSSIVRIIAAEHRYKMFSVSLGRSPRVDRVQPVSGYAVGDSIMDPYGT